MNFEELLQTYGYPMLFLGVQVEGEIFIMLGVYLVQKGYFSLTGIVLVAALSSFLSTQLYFFLGHRYGRAFLAKRPRWQTRVSRVPGLLQRYGATLVLGYRALYGIRIIIPPALGLFNYSVIRFILLDGSGALLWALVVTLAGRQLAQLAEMHLATIRHHEGLVVLILVSVGVLWGLSKFFHRTRLPEADQP